MKTFTFELLQSIEQSIMRKTKQSVKVHTKLLTILLLLLTVGVGNVWGEEKICSFDGKKPSNSAFTVTGNYKTGLSKTINGKEYTTALKMESATEVTFSIDKEMTLTLVTDGAEGKKIKVDGESYAVDANGYLTITLSAATHTITKGDAINLFYINLQTSSSGGGGETPDPEPEPEPEPDQPGTGGDCYSDLAYSGGASMPTGWTIVSNDAPMPQIKNNTIAMQNGGLYAYSSGAPARGMYFDANQNATISITSYCANSRAFCLVEKNGDQYSIIQTWDAEETLTAEIISGRRYYLTSKAGSKDGAKCNIKVISFSDCVSQSCTPPTSVEVTPTNEFGWRYSLGETISLTATPTGGSGNYTYQWQKFIGDTWTNIDGATAATYSKTNCTTSDGGSYRCVVTTGTDCSYDSEGYFIRVFTLNGGYITDGEWTAHKIVWTGENTGVVSLTLPVSDTYYFKVTDNDGKWFGFGDASNYIIQPWQADCGTGNSNIRLFTGPAGDYKFTINIEHAQENSPYVNIKVDYPVVTHPVEGYAYINKWWDCYVHYWDVNDNALTAWGNDPKINDDRYVNICGTDYWYFPVIETYTNFIAKDNAGNPANTTGNQTTTNHSGQNITHNGSAWVWQEFSTYSITFNANGGTGSMTDVTGITCGGSATLTQNAFTRTGYTFAGWATAADGEVAYADKATINNITANITLYAKWNKLAEDYTLTYNSNQPSAWNAVFAIKNIPAEQTLTGGTGNVSNNTPVITDGAESDYWIYEFNGWNTAADGSGTSYAAGAEITIAENTTLYAQWTPRTFNITYYDTDLTTPLTGLTPTSYTYGTGATLPTPTKAGYTFTGWILFWNGGENDKTEVNTDDWGDVQLAAQWTENTPVTPPTQGGGVTAMWPMVDGEAVSLVGNATHASVTLSNASKNGDLITIEGTQTASYTDYTKRMAIVKVSSNLNDNNTSINANNYIKYTLTVAQGYTFTPTGFSAKIGRQGTDNGSAQVVLKKGNTTLASTDISQPSRNSKSVPISVFEKTIDNASACVASETIDLYVYFGGKMSGKQFLISEVNIYGTYAPTTPTPEPEGEAIITNTLATGTVAWNSSISTTDATNITNLTALAATSLTISGEGNTNNGGQTAKITGTENAKNTAEYMSLSFRVACGKKLVVSGIEIPVQPVSSNTNNFEALLTDGTTTITGTINNVTNGTLQNITFNSYGELVGNVTLKLYAWGWTEGYRMGKAVKIYGTIEDGVTPQATITWTTQPANGQVGAADFEYAVSCSDGSEVTVTSENTDVASIVDGKLHYVAEGSTRLVATATDKCGNVITSYSNQFTVGAMVKYAVTHTLSNVTATVGATGAEAATEGAAYAATFAAANGFVLPNTITVTIGGATQAAGTGYTWKPETGELNIPADKVKGDIVITIAGQVKAPELICEELFYAKADSKSTFAATVGTIVASTLGNGDELSDVDGFEFSVKPDNSSNSLIISPKDGYDFQEGDIITVWLYNSNNSAKAMGISLKSNGTKTVSVPTKTLQSLTVTLIKNDITTSDGNTTIVIGRNSSDARWVAVQVERCVEESCTEPSTILAITADPTVQASQTAAISVTGGNEGPIAFTVTPATGAVTGNDGAYSFSATEVGDYVIKATQADFNGVCGGNATCVISVTAIGSLTEPTITATDLNEDTADAFTFCETDNDDALKVVATSPEEGVTYAYQWYVKETDSNVFTAITGATEAIYPPTMDGTYYCEVTAKKPGYASASAKSKEWTITITQSTAIKSQPTSVALEGGQATLEVEAEGENLQYQWYSCEDVNKTNAQAIAGATHASYTTTQTGYYYVVVKSDCGVDRTSDVVEVTKEVEYCFNMIKNAEKGTIAAGTNVDVTSYFDVTEGAKITFTMGGDREANANGVKFDNNKDQMTITLPEGSMFAAGSIIEFVVSASSDNRGLIIDGVSVTGTRTNNLISLSYTLPADFTTSQSLSFTRAGGTLHLRSLSVSNCGESCSDNTPTLSASTTNISASTSVTLTASNYTAGATLSFYKEGVAEPLQTGAGNTCTVTVDVTSTFYVVAVKDCERRSSSVTVTFTCGTPQPKIIQVGGVLGCNETVTLKAVTQEGTDIPEGTLQWYKNGGAIAGANAATLELNLEDVGEYTVSLTNGCMAMSTNTAVVSNEVPEPELEVLAPRQYYQLNHDYTEEQQLRYLMKLTLPEGTDVAGATDGAYQITATLEENTLDATQFVENKIEEGVYWIMLNLNSLTANADTYGLAAGDIISIKVTPLNLCGEYPAELAHTVEVKVTDKPTLAFIVSGADGNGTKEKKSHKVNGDFLTGYNKADLCLQTGTTSFDNTQELPLYTYLKEYFEVVPVNGYAPYNYYNYDPFDIALLTDFPKTKAGVGNDTLISAANLNALADLVDRKPLLSLKTHMVNTALGAWSEKGFIENPLTTKNQVNMTLLCHAHEMFKEDITIAPDDEGNVQVDILTQVGFDVNKGMQGFRALASTNFINIATTVNSADNTNLVACCERQAIVQARMLLLSINADATSFISDNGKIVIRNALHYLLQTDPTHVSDCSIEFDNGGVVGRTVTLKGKTYTSGDNEWGNPANWSTSTLPNQANNVLIEANCQVTNKHAQSGVGVYGVANVRINENYTLTIAPTGGVVSTGLFAVYKPGEKYSAKQITDPKYVTVQANETNTGLLMHSHQETLHATVQMYSPANHDKEGGYNTAGFHKVKNYTDVAVPVEVDATFFQNNGHEAQYWKWNEKGTVGFERQTTGTVPHFQGGCISHCDPQLFSFTGQVALAKDHPYEMTYSESGWYGINVVGNSWTAPIQILELTAADFGSNLEQTIYIYNTGHDATAGTGVASQADFSTPGQWMAIPIDVAKTGEWAGPKVIPAMQAFQVLTLYPLVTPADGETQAESQTLTIGYNKHIRCRGAVNGLTQKLYAPQRPKKAPRTGLPSTAEVLMPDPNKVDTFVTPTMLRVMFVADSVKTDVYLFEDDQRFKNGFDNGWDGTYQNDETVSGAYVLTEAGNMAISAQPYLEGTTVALKSKKTTTFQCTFKYTGTETLYLNDTKLEQSTKIEEGASYVFMASPEDAPNRFVISAEPYQGSITGMAGVVMVDNALVVNNPLQEPLRVFIYDAVGRTHHVYDTKAAMEEINLPNVPGVYLIRVKGENTDLVHKVVR